MARRREENGIPAEVLPLELLGPGARNPRREWLAARGVRTGSEIAAAMRLARRAHGIADPPDPREMFRDPDNYTTNKET